MATRPHRFETRLIHAGELEPRVLGAVSTPIFQSSTFEYGGEGSYHDIRYLRLSNSPNHLVLHRRLAALEGAEAALVTASGMAAITTTLLSLLSSGDHLLIQDSLYGGTHDFVREDLPASWEAQVKPNTRAPSSTTPSPRRSSSARPSAASTCPCTAAPSTSTATRTWSPARSSAARRSSRRSSTSSTTSAARWIPMPATCSSAG